ncbi:helix-turn-helix domain-containing protein [Actinokineospora soli]|uniref:Helix-turn-helix domain-containing protein n=1 Tax=Actinokineospora soli TaxID=1048753 RepID=A0ABW2TV08_9PSEU
MGLTALAAKADVPRSTLHAYVSGRSLPPAEVLDRIVIELGASPAEQAAWAEAWYRVAAGVAVAKAACGVPRQLPPDVSAFTGRAGALAELDELLGGGVGVVSAVAGTAGWGRPRWSCTGGTGSRTGSRAGSCT